MGMSSVTIPAALKARAERQAKREGVSLTKLVSQSIKDHLAGLHVRRLDPVRDSFFADKFVIDGGPTDVAENHDKYLVEMLEVELEKNGHNPKPGPQRRKR